MRETIKILNQIGFVLLYVALVMLFVLMILGSADVLGRYLFDSPIKGTREIGSILIVGIVVFSWAYVQMKGAHVTVTIAISRLPLKVQAVAKLGSLFLSLALFIIICWQATKVAITNWETGRLIPVLLVPIAPFQLIVSLGAFVICLQFIVQIVQCLQNKDGD